MCMLEKNKHIYPPLKQNTHTHTHTHTHIPKQCNHKYITVHFLPSIQSGDMIYLYHQSSDHNINLQATCIISPLITILTFKPNMLHNFAKLHIHGHTLQTLILQKSRSGFCRAQLQHFDYHGYLTLSVAAMLRIWQLTRY